MSDTDQPMVLRLTRDEYTLVLGLANVGLACLSTSTSLQLLHRRSLPGVPEPLTQETLSRGESAIRALRDQR